MKKKYILFILCFLLLALVSVGFYFWWISPPLGSHFTLWQDSKLAWEENERADVVLSFVNCIKTKNQIEGKDDLIWIECDIENNSKNLFVYDSHLYKIDCFYINQNIVFDYLFISSHKPV